MLDWLGISALNPGLLWGALLVASPILIHLLAKRKFKVVDWAAMDFLRDADKRNRRRLRLEDLLLLALRCLAVILIAALVARLYFTESGLGALALEQARFERIILVDDSLSTRVHAGNQTLFDQTRRQLADFVRQLAARRAGDTLTLIVTSRRDEPVLAGRYLNAESAEAVVQAIEGLRPTDRPAEMQEALLAVQRHLASRAGHPNRLLYVITDLRQRDWLQTAAQAGGPAATPGADAPSAPRQGGAPAIIKRLADEVQALYLVDVGQETDGNLVVTGITPQEKTLVAGVDATFDVSVLNAGESDAEGTELAFTAGESVSLRGRLPRVPAGQTASAPFTFRFEEPGWVPVRAEIGADPLPADNVRYYAAAVSAGVQVLIVDGDPSSDPLRSESLFLARALAPPGDTRSSYAVQIVTEDQFEIASLTPYQAVFLCNVYRLSDERVASLEQWVRGGGGLAVFLGGQVDDQMYNRCLYREGKGLLPLRLVTPRGDERASTWANLVVADIRHPVLGAFEDPALRPLITGVKIFRWWGADVDRRALAAGEAAVAANLTDTDGSPALVQKRFGDGMVLAVTFPSDADWSDWPANPSYIVATLEMARHIARRTTAEGNSRVGQAIGYALDAGRYQVQASLVPPGESQPTPLQPTGEGSTVQFLYDQTERAGFYELRLVRLDGEAERVLFAANVDPDEGRLQRADPAELARRIGDKARLVRGTEVLAANASGTKAEFWRSVLVALAVVLGAEQLLAWAFGRRR